MYLIVRNTLRARIALTARKIESNRKMAAPLNPPMLSRTNGNAKSIRLKATIVISGNRRTYYVYLESR